MKRLERVDGAQKHPPAPLGLLGPPSPSQADGWAACRVTAGLPAHWGLGGGVAHWREQVGTRLSHNALRGWRCGDSALGVSSGAAHPTSPSSGAERGHPGTA